MCQASLQAWESLGYVVYEHVFDRRYDIIFQNLLQVEDDRSDGIRDFLDVHGCWTAYDGFICGGSGNGNI